MIVVIQTYLPRQALDRSIHKASHVKRVDTYIRYLIRILLFFLLLALWCSCELSKTKQHRASERASVRASVRGGGENEWTGYKKHSNSSTNAYNGSDSHKYRLVFFSSKGENDKYKNGRAYRFCFDIFLIYVYVFLLLMNIFSLVVTFFCFTIFFFAFRQCDVGYYFATTQILCWVVVPAHFMKRFQTYILCIVYNVIFCRFSMCT